MSISLLLIGVMFQRDEFLWTVFHHEILSHLRMIDRSPPKEKEKKLWNPFDQFDPNFHVHSRRALIGSIFGMLGMNTAIEVISLHPNL